MAPKVIFYLHIYGDTVSMYHMRAKVDCEIKPVTKHRHRVGTLKNLHLNFGRTE